MPEQIGKIVETFIYLAHRIQYPLLLPSMQLPIQYTTLQTRSARKLEKQSSVVDLFI